MFHGIQPRRYRDVLDCLHASVHQYPRNTHLVELGEQSHNTGILLDGTVEEFLYDENGNQVSICRLASVILTSTKACSKPPFETCDEPIICMHEFNKIIQTSS